MMYLDDKKDVGCTIFENKIKSLPENKKLMD